MITVPDLFNLHVPLRTVRTVNESCPWFNKKVRLAIRNRNKLHVKWRKKMTDFAWSQYKSARSAFILG